MAEGCDKQRWNHTSQLLALIANANRDPKKGRTFRPSDFNPYAKGRRTGMPITKRNLKVLKSVFVRPANRRKEDADGTRAEPEADA